MPGSLPWANLRVLREYSTVSQSTLRGAWGKADGYSNFHALEAHCMDVAAVFAAVCELPVFADRLSRLAGGKLDPSEIRELTVLVYLHDLGKLSPGFQAKARPEMNCPAHVNHSIAGYLLLSEAAHSARHPLHPLTQIMTRWRGGTEEIMTAIFAHHGRPLGLPSGRVTLDGGGNHYNVITAVDAYIGMLHRAFPNTAATPLPDSPGFVHMIAGLTALADWIGSDRRFFDYVADPGADYPDIARRRAREALRTIGLDSGGVRPSTSFASVAGDGCLPRAAQSLVGVSDPRDSQLLLLEAETGSGKTEAALWRYALLHAAGLVSGLYFAVPTRSAARQLHRRVDAAMKRLFGHGAPEAVLAIPGQIVAGEAAGQRLPAFETRWDDAEGAQPARWAAEHATRFLAAAVAVGTVDQAMLSGLKVKHAPMRAAALSRSLLVIDEIHASDAFMSEILGDLLKGHLAAGGHAMLMSATLGSRARARVLEHAAPSLQEAINAPYPALWSIGRPAPAVARSEGRHKAVAMEQLSTMDPLVTAQHAIRLARQGARVLVIRNTVGMACATFDAILAEGAGNLLMQAAGGPALHHSRFAAEDRKLLDTAVEEVLGPKQERETKGVIIIGTQTLEQSLDICADILISDLCPVDVLLQRIGRLHRHPLPRPAGFETPCCLVLCPEDGLDPLAAPAFFNGLGAWRAKDGTVQGIYIDLPCLALTQGLVETRPLWNIPAMNRELVERATHPEARAAEISRRGVRWADYEAGIIGKDLAQAGQASRWLLRRSEPFPETFPDADEHVQTRLGAEGPLLELTPGTIGPFGREITRIAVPAHWGVTAPDRPVTVEMAGDGLLLIIGDQPLLYGRLGLTSKKA